MELFPSIDIVAIFNSRSSGIYSTNNVRRGRLELDGGSPEGATPDSITLKISLKEIIQILIINLLFLGILLARNSRSHHRKRHNNQQKIWNAMIKLVR